MDLVPKPDQVVAGGRQRRPPAAVRRPGRPAPDAAHADRRRHAARGLPLPAGGDGPRARRPGAAGDAARRAGDLLRPAPRLLAGRAPRRRGPADLPRGVRRGVVPRPQPRAWSTGSTRSLPAAVREASAHAGGRPVHVVGWSLGGIFALLAAADHPDLPIASLTVLGSPVDVTQVPLVAPLRPLLGLTDGRGLRHPRLPRAGRRADSRWCSWAFQLSSFQKLVTKPLAVADPPRRRRLPRAARGGRPVHRPHDRLPRPDLRPALPPVRQGQRARGRHDRARRPRRSSLSAITAPVLVFAGANDGIAPVAAVRAVVPLLTGSRDVRFEIVPGGHLGHAHRPGRPRHAPGGCSTSGSSSGRATTRRPDAGKKAPAKKAAPKKAAEARRSRRPRRPPPRRRPRGGNPRRDTASARTRPGATARPAPARSRPPDLARRPLASRPCQPATACPAASGSGYGSGSVATGAFGTVPGLMLLPYLTDSLGIAALLAGLHRVPAEGVGRDPQPDRRPDQRPHRRPARPAPAVAAARRPRAGRRRSRCSSRRPRSARTVSRRCGCWSCSSPARRRTRSSRCRTSRCPPRSPTPTTSAPG